MYNDSAITWHPGDNVKTSVWLAILPWVNLMGRETTLPCDDMCGNDFNTTKRPSFWYHDRWLLASSSAYNADWSGSSSSLASSSSFSLIVTLLAVNVGDEELLALELLALVAVPIGDKLRVEASRRARLRASSRSSDRLSLASAFCLVRSRDCFLRWINNLTLSFDSFNRDNSCCLHSCSHFCMAWTSSGVFGDASLAMTIDSSLSLSSEWSSLSLS